MKFVTDQTPPLPPKKSWIRHSFGDSDFSFNSVFFDRKFLNISQNIRCTSCIQWQHRCSRFCLPKTASSFRSHHHGLHRHSYDSCGLWRFVNCEALYLWNRTDINTIYDRCRKNSVKKSKLYVIISNNIWL